MTDLCFELHEKQAVAFESPATEILYGGSAGGGKSHLIRVAAIVWALQIPGLQIYIFRRHHGDLHKNHMAGETSFPVMLAPLVQAKQCRIVEGEIRFPSGSTIHLCHCQHEKDKYKYQGAEIHCLIVDEATHFSESIYRYLRGRVRMGANGLAIPDALKGLFPRIILCTNPGGIGHNWVKHGWVKPYPPLTVWKTGKHDGGFLRQYIPAKVRDNPSLDAESYEANLAGLGDPSLVKAMLDGNWDIVAGGALDDVWSDKVVIERFRVPVGWTVDRCFDWGDSSPFAVLWVAEADGTESKHLVNGKPFCPPRGSLIVLQEWYGATDGTEGARVGLKMPISQIAQGIISREQALRSHWLMRVHPGPADNAINVAVSGMPSIGEVMASEGVYWTESDKSPGSRINGLALMRELLAETKKPRPERPCLYIMDNCRNLIENLPVLPRDPKKPDDVATGAEDHDYDALRYRVLAMKRGSVESLRI